MWQYQCSDVAISVIMITLERQLIIKNVNVIGVLLDFILLKTFDTIKHIIALCN